MELTRMGAQQTPTFELPAPLTFQQIFQSCPYWVGGTSGFTPQVVKSLRNNPRKQSYLLRVDERQLVLSVARRRQTNTPLIENAARAGIAPAVLYDAHEQGFVVTEYLEGRCWSSADFKTLANIERLAELLKQLHSLPDEGPLLSALETEQRYLRSINRELFEIPKRLQALQQRINQLICHVEVHYPERVACHNNLLTSQVIETSAGLALTGWEYAALNDAFYELAVVVHNHGLNEVQLDHLLRCYAGGNGVKEREHFYCSYAIYIYLDALRYLLRSAPDPQADQEAAIEMKTDTLVAVLHQLGI